MTQRQHYGGKVAPFWNNCWVWLEDMKWLLRKFSWKKKKKKMEGQKPSQCKCLLPFLTGTLSHQLQHKIKTWLPNWSISNAVNILNAALNSETKTPDENTWQKPVGWKILSRETDEENSGSFRLGSWRHHAVISAAEKLFTPNSIWF